MMAKYMMRSVCREIVGGEEITYTTPVCLWHGHRRGRGADQSLERMADLVARPLSLILSTPYLLCHIDSKK